MASLNDEQLEKMIHEISVMGSKLAKAEATYEKLVYHMKHQKDLAFVNLKEEKMTLKEKEAIANTSPEVYEYFDKIAKAKEEYLSLRHKIKAREIWCDMFRSLNSSRKREMKFVQDLG
tara:strand:- start:805 stop:1158 length:354 start_codon:yes stop_codon:yes gene_type:complete